MARQIRVEIIGDPRRLRAAFREAERSTTGFSRGIARAGVFAATGLAGVAVGAGVAITAAVKSAATFDRTLRQMAAITDIPAAGLENLRKLALKMGADTQFSAQQAADAMLELAKGGLTEAQIKAGGLKATLTLAAAGSLDLADAATFMSNALNGFAIDAKDAAKVAAALAGGANASTASVESLGEALSQVGPGARNAGLSLQQTVGVLAAFDQAGIKGSDAGTSLKTMLASLVPQTARAKSAMHDLGLSFVDAHGAIVPITEVAQRLHDRLGKLTQAQRISALQTIFGSDATRAATVLMREGAKGIERYIRATLDQDAAQKLAKTSMEGTAGALEQMQGSIETAKIALGTAFAPAATAAAKAITKIANKASDLIQKHGPALGAFFDDLGGKAGEFATKHGPDFRKVLRDVGTSLDSLRQGVTDPNNGAVAGLEKLQRAWEENAQAIKDFKDALPEVQTMLRVVGFLAGRAGEEISGLGRLLIGLGGLAARGALATRIALDGLGIAALQLSKFFQTMAINFLDSLATIASHVPGLSGRIASALRGSVDSMRRTRVDTQAQIDQLKADASKRFDELRRHLEKPIHARVDVRGTVSWSKDAELLRSLTGNFTHKLPAFSTGGRITQGSGPTADDVLARLSRGETIVPAAASARPEFQAWARMQGIPGFAAGGIPSPALLLGLRGAANQGLQGATRAALVGASALRAAPSISGTGSVAQVAAKTLALLARPLAELGAWIRRIMFESGGNWSAVNRTDSNWLAGHPSVGGAQVIRGTFARWAGPLRGVGPFLYGVSINPLANSYAGANYAIHRYGSLAAVDPRVRPYGYDHGGMLPPGLSLAYNGTGRAEPVGIDYDRLAAALARQPIVVQVDGRALATIIRQETYRYQDRNASTGYR